MIVHVVEPVINASEGTVAAVCMFARFPSLSTNIDVNVEKVTVNVSIAAQGSASMYHV